MGCTFDCFTSTWNSRSYLITLLIVAWVIPLIVILNSHLRIIVYLRKANIQSLFISNLPCRSRLHSNDVRHNEQGLDQEESSCGDNKCFPHVTQRVRSELKSQLLFYGFKSNVIYSNKFNHIDVYFISHTAFDGRKTVKNGHNTFTRMVCRVDTICRNEFVDHDWCQVPLTRTWLDSHHGL